MADAKTPSGPSDLLLVLLGFAVTTLLALWMLLSETEAPHDHGAHDGHDTAASGGALPPPAAPGSATAPR